MTGQPDPIEDEATASSRAEADPAAGGVPADPAEGAPEGARTSLWRNRDFTVVMTGQTVSAFGDAITMTAMPLLVLYLTGSAGLLAIVIALQAIPDLLFALPAGAMADRRDRKRMMFWSDVGRTVLTLAIPISFWLGGPTLAILLVVTLPINVLRVLSDTAFGSSFPALAGRENLGRANSAMESAMSVPYIVGPAIAGVLVAIVGAATTLAIDAATFAVSAAAVLLVRRTLRAERPVDRPPFIADVRAGIAFVWRHPLLRTLIGYWAAVQVAISGLIATLGYHITLERGLGPEVFGLLGSVWSIGYLGGSILSGRLRRRPTSQLIGGGLVLGLAVVAVPLVPSVVVLLGAAALIGASLAVMFVAYASAQQKATPDELLGRVGSTGRLVSLGLRAFGVLAIGALIEVVGGALALAVMSGAVIVSSLLLAASRAHRLHSGPAPADPDKEETAPVTTA